MVGGCGSADGKVTFSQALAASSLSQTDGRIGTTGGESQP